MTHEQKAVLHGYLAEFAADYPSLCEGEAKAYRDVARACIIADIEECSGENLLLGRGVFAAMNLVALRQARGDVGRFAVARLASDGVNVRACRDVLRVSPAWKVTPKVHQDVTAYRREIRCGLLDAEEVPC